MLSMKPWVNTLSVLGERRKVVFGRKEYRPIISLSRFSLHSTTNQHPPPRRKFLGMPPSNHEYALSERGSYFIINLCEKKCPFVLWKSIMFSVEPAGVSHVFCGHYHMNCTTFYKTVEIVTTNAVGAPMGPMEPSGLRIVQVNEDNLVHTYYPLEEMPSAISSWKCKTYTIKILM